MNQQEVQKWEQQRAKGRFYHIVITSLTFAAAYFLISVLFGPLWPLFRGADFQTTLANVEPGSWWVRKAILSVAMGVALGFYNWNKNENKYKQHLASETTI